MTDAKTLLNALRMKHSSDAVVREVVVDDPFEMAIRRRWDVENGRKWAGEVGAQNRLDRYATRGETVAEEVPEGWSYRGSVPRRRIDALIIASTGRTAVEIKVTRADFRRDTEEKRRAWRAICHRFIYLTPKGLVTPEEVPDGCGLVEYDPEKHDPRYAWKHGLTTVKRATITKEPDALPWQVTQALAYRVSRSERASIVGAGQ